jgi:Family of unknown function (DUF6193)
MSKMLAKFFRRLNLWGQLFSKRNHDLYSDLTALGGLTFALQFALHEIGSSLTVSNLNKEINFVVFAFVESESRFSQVYIASQERMFLFDFWARGVMLAQAQTPHLTEVARAIDKWVASGCNTAALASDFSFVTLENKASIYEQGKEVEDRWRAYLVSPDRPELMPMIVSASRRPLLRQLFPYTSLDTLCFSRCTGYPYSRDTPCVRPLKKGLYEVIDFSGKVLACGDAEDAAEMIVNHLPPNCGAAVPGTAKDLVDS